MPYTLAAAMLVAVGVPSVSAHPGKGKGQGGGKHGHRSCDVASCDVQGPLETICPCEDMTSHGAYVRCVAHAAKGLVADSTIGRNCRGKLVRLAAHATCGRTDPVVCLLPTSTCDDDGSCTNDPSVDCADDTDCGTQCSVMTSDDCDAANGIASDAGSCAVAGCFSPSGAFLGLQ
jgi:hypothetical protein